MTLTSSVVVARALDVAPLGEPSQKHGLCAFCGLEITPDDRVTDLKKNISKGFMDDLSLAARGSQMLCGYCTYLKSDTGLKAAGGGYGVFSPAGVQSFRKWAEVAEALTNPPEPPFVMIYATAQNQHMAWRAPVNLSRDLYYVRVGLKDLKIRRQHLVEAVEHCRILGEALYPPQSTKPGKKTVPVRKTLPHPFLELAPDLKDTLHGVLNPRIFDKEFDGLSEHLRAVMALTAGEVWGLRFVLTPGAGQP